jgi:predicted ABC-type sugar transport system permease subunit
VAVIGIYVMGFVILVSGLGAFGMAVAYAVRPTERKLALMRPLSLASIFAAVCSFFGGVATVLGGLAATLEVGPPRIGLVLMGFRETIIPLFVAFAFLSVAWLLVVLGMRPQE